MDEREKRGVMEEMEGRDRATWRRARELLKSRKEDACA